jgi:ATP-binding cassette subfamily B multidrug efflux pump
MLRWFERRIDPFRPAPLDTPPDHLGRFYLHYLRQAWPVFAAALAAGLFAAIVEASLFTYMGELIDLVRAASDSAAFFAENGRLLLWMVFVAAILKPALFGLHTLLVNQSIIMNFASLVRWQNHRYLLRQSLSYFQNDFAGRVANKVMDTGAALRGTLTQLVDAIWYVAVYLVTTLVVFFQNDWRLMLPIFVWMAALGAMMVYFVPKLKQLSAVASEARSTLVGRVVDSYTNILTVKLFAHTEGEDGYARDALTSQLEKSLEQFRAISRMEISISLVNGLLISIASGMALWLWGKGLITVGAVAVTAAFVIRLNGLAGWVMFTVAGVFESIGTVQQGVETIAKPITVKDRPAAPALIASRGEIRFENVAFHYGRGAGLMEDLSFVIRPGEKVGLVGRSGAGKSTLVNLLLRFYDLEGGRILIDGQNIAEVTQDSLREAIGMVTQDTSLLHRSVMDNIRYGKPEASEGEAVAAAKKAHAHEFIAGLEDLNRRKGYNAHVGERGVKLSGGQRQRIAIARVLLKNAPILILDEATSALDSEVEAAIQEQLYNLMEGKTVIAIAHRLSTIAAMDRLIVMDCGRIVEDGSHEQLLKRGGVYARLWRRQSGGFLAEEDAA